MSFPMRAVILLEEALRQDWVWVWVLECVHEVMPLRDSVQFMPARGSDTQLLIALTLRSSANPSKIATVRKPEHNSDHLERVKRGTMALVVISVVAVDDP